MNPRLILLLALTIGAGHLTAAEPKATPAPASSVTSPAAGKTGTAATPAARTDSSVTPTASYDTFRLITDRNIFNPNRSGRRERVIEETPPRVDSITLVGTMNSDHGLMSFFNGSEAAYRKALRVGESIAEFKITRIGTEGIDLERDGKTYTLRVGQQFRRPEGADWNILSADVVRQEAQAQAQAAASMQADPSAPVVIPSDADEVTKRMMQRRNQQLKQ